ncbi:carbohydrate ABC transporter permease [Paenibacillus gansuensis]|uniref:Carbohydrate ABC transporter permease n=1 Tax=Paenibacillus gansuensis TaxID=306542 RepID=A0ABW5P7J7_9BACL
MSKTVNSSLQRHTAVKASFFLLPASALMIFFFFVPVAMTFFYAFTNKTLNGLHAKQYDFVGFDNFVFLFSDDNFRAILLNTLVFLFFSAIVGQQVLGFITAYLMDEKPKFIRSAVGIILIAAWVVPETICAFIWFAFFSDEGTLNRIMDFVGIKPIAWLITFPMISVIVANIWRGTAFSMMVFQAALGDVPKDIKEAAKMDGASGFQMLIRVTLPVIKNAILMNMVLITLATLGVFTLIFAMTGGGPGIQTETLPLYMYHQAFVGYQIGYGTAIALILLSVGIVASLLYIRILRVKV